MTRDMDLIRLILLEVEQRQDVLRSRKVIVEGYSPEQIAYHVKLLAQANLVDVIDFTTFDGLDMRPRSLTWAGHEFIDATRNESVWHKVKAQVNDRGLSLPFELIQQLAIKIAAAAAGL